MRYLLILLLLCGCANTKAPVGGWTTKNGSAPAPGVMTKDWNDCVDETAAARAFSLAWRRNSSTNECMYAKGWL